MLVSYIDKIKKRESLTIDEAYNCFNTILEGSYPDEQIAELLTILSNKGENVGEIIGFAKVLLDKSKKININNNAIDLCGTGGSNLNRFNISTTSAFVLAAGGVQVIKHGNKGSKKPNGSFDLLENLGINHDIDDSKLLNIYDKTNLSFLFARKFHPIMKKVANARKLANIRTIFNIIGPLCNPADPYYQIIGTTDLFTAKKIAKSLIMLGRKRFLVIVGYPGIDEISISGKTKIIDFNKDKIEEYDVDPDDFKIKNIEYRKIPAGNADKNSKIFYKLIKSSKPSSILDMVCINSGAAFYCADTVGSINDGYNYAKELFKRGKVKEKFEEYKSMINE